MTELIITADDYCAHPYINRGIEDAILKGCINTVSAFMNIGKNDVNGLPSSAEQVRNLKLKFPHINVGVHLTISSGKPVLPYNEVPSLYRKKSQTNFMELHDFSFNKVDIHELNKELNAQLKQFPPEFNIDHISCHQGILTMTPKMFKLYVSLANKLDISIRNPGIISRTKLKGFRKISKMKQTGIKNGFLMVIDNDASLGDVLRMSRYTQPKRMWKRCCLWCKYLPPSYFIDTFYGNCSPDRLKQILRDITKISDNASLVELVVHLGKGDTNPKPMDGVNKKYFDERAEELDTICKPNLLQTLMEKNNIDWGVFEKLNT